jgi:glycosyltransferase involved in cell wall biosynthesis
MRVLMIAPEPWFTPRGTPCSVLHRIFAMSTLEHKIDLVTYHLGEDVHIRNLTIHRIPQLPFINRLKVGPSKSKVIVDFFLILLSLRLLHHHRYDLIFSHEEASFFSTILARCSRIPHIYDMHSCLPQQLSNFKFTRIKILVRVFEWLEDITLRNADGIITICPELQNYVEERFPDKSSILIENVADNSLIFQDDNERINTLKKQSDVNGAVTVLYCGTFEPYQGIDLLIESSQYVTDKVDTKVKFILVGGSPLQVEHYRSVAENKNLNEHFIFTGSVRPQEVPGFVRNADVLVSPRIAGNNTPLKIYSYLRSGKPIIATRHVTHTQVLNDNVAILTDCNPSAFGEGIVRAIQDKGLRQRVVKNAQALAEERYSYGDYLKKLDFILLKAVDNAQEGIG